MFYPHGVEEYRETLSTGVPFLVKGKKYNAACTTVWGSVIGALHRHGSLT